MNTTIYDNDESSCLIFDGGELVLTVVRSCSEQSMLEAIFLFDAATPIFANNRFRGKFENAHIVIGDML